MNWITNFVRPSIKRLFTSSDSSTPEELWRRCDECGSLLYHRELTLSQNVCINCDHHMQIAPKERFAKLFDGGAYTEVPVPIPTADPLNFRDQKRYVERIRAAQKKTGETEAMLVAEGAIYKTQFVAAAQDFRFMGGSMGMYVGNAFVAACEKAIEKSTPLVVFSAAGGARMQEGILSLMQMPRVTVAIQRLKQNTPPLPYIVVLTDPTTGGVTASYAMLGDVQIAEPKALICFAGPRVIEQTIREKLPEGFQRSEYLLEHGLIDRVTHRQKLRDEIVSIALMLMKKAPPVKGEITALPAKIVEKNLN